MTNGMILDQCVTEDFAAYHGDTVAVMSALPARSVGMSVFSPPFASLYTYTNSDRDIGNVRDDEEFFGHFDFVVRALTRVTMAGRHAAFHCMDLPTSKERDGYIGQRDFRGDLIRAFERVGRCDKCSSVQSRPSERRVVFWPCAEKCGGVAQAWVLHSQTTIWKDPVTSMQRTKALGLLHKTVRENAAMSRMGIPDYLVALRAPGEAPREERVTHDPEEYPVSMWQQVASPVWMDINPSDTLQHESAREEKDERHICPLQLEVIRRAVDLWTNPGDVVLSPFMGIGSEGHIALGGSTRAGARIKRRKFVGAELKASYYQQAVANLKAAVASDRQLAMFT